MMNLTDKRITFSIKFGLAASHTHTHTHMGQEHRKGWFFLPNRIHPDMGQLNGKIQNRFTID